MTFALFAIFGGFLLWAIRTHQFRDVEEANRRLFADDDHAPESDPTSKEPTS